MKHNWYFGSSIKLAASHKTDKIYDYELQVSKGMEYHIKLYTYKIDDLHKMISSF